MNGVQGGEGECVPLPQYAIRSGPRKTIYWQPEKVGHCITSFSE